MVMVMCAVFRIRIGIFHSVLFVQAAIDVNRVRFDLRKNANANEAANRSYVHAYSDDRYA
jgi:hypothetical protein